MKNINKKVLSVAMSLILAGLSATPLKAHNLAINNHNNSLANIKKSKVINKILAFSLPGVALIAGVAGLTYYFTKSPNTPPPKTVDLPTKKTDISKSPATSPPKTVDLPIKKTDISESPDTSPPKTMDSPTKNPFIPNKTNYSFDLEKYRVKEVGARTLPNGTLFTPEPHIVLNSDQFRDYLSTTKQLVYFRGIDEQQNTSKYTDDFVWYGLGISTTPEAKGNRANADNQRPGDPVYFAHYLETPFEFAGRFKYRNKKTYSMIYVAVVSDNNSDVEEYGLKYMDENKNFVLCKDPFIIYPNEWDGVEYKRIGSDSADKFYGWLRNALKNNPNSTDCDGVLYRFKKWIFSKGLVFKTSTKGNTYCVYDPTQADKLLSQME